jgi:hypothetical protein
MLVVGCSSARFRLHKHLEMLREGTISAAIGTTKVPIPELMN